MTVKIGILGLGHIGYYHIKALQALPEYNLAAACDLKLEHQNLLPDPVAFYTDVNSFLADKSLDTVIIATPNDTHYKFGCAAFESGKNVIMEKPAAESIDDFELLDRMYKNDNALHIYYAFHSAKAFDVTWFKKYYCDEVNRMTLGPITSFSCTFYDPYIVDGQLNHETKGLGSPWIDSGVNALSVLAELMDIRVFSVVSSSTTHLNVADVPVQTLVQFEFPVEGKGCAGMGSINTNWALGINQKKTYLAFAFSGSLVELDHSAQRVLLKSSDHGTIVLKDFSEAGERLYNHYIGVFKDYLACLKKNSFNNNTSRQIHDKLFLAEHWRTDC